MTQAFQRFFDAQMPAPPDPGEFPNQEKYRAAWHQWRAEGVRRRRDYYFGRQYDELNEACLAEAVNQQRRLLDTGGLSEYDIARGAFKVPELPEHLRMHEYTSTIRSCTEYLTARLVDGFELAVAPAEDQDAEGNDQRESPDEAARQSVLQAWRASPQLAGAHEGELAWTTTIRHALQAGDVPVLLRWASSTPDGDMTGTVWCEFWPSDVVDLRFIDVNTLTKVIVRQQQWRPKVGEDGNPSDDEELVTVRREWEVLTSDLEPADELDSESLQPADAVVECVERWWIERGDGPDDDDELIEPGIRWGVPFLPWWTVRGATTSLDSYRGDSVITDVAMKAADRLNAVEGLSWKIARYNSHGNVAISGDQALLASQTTVISKDVADILMFPAGTDMEVLTLPTDAQMIEQQRATLLNQLHDEFGVTRADQSSLAGFGQITGYALEILNMKADGTFDKLRQRLAHDIIKLANLILDCHAYWSAAAPGFQPAEHGLMPLPDLDPDDVYPDRALVVTLGGGSIIDAAKLRDDVVAGLISRKMALRKQGWTDAEIDQNERELAEERTQTAAADRSAITGGGTENGQFRGTRSGAGRVQGTTGTRGAGR